MMSMKAILEAVKVFKREIEAQFKAYTELFAEHDILQARYRELKSSHDTIVEEHEERDARYKSLLNDRELTIKTLNRQYQDVLTERESTCHTLGKLQREHTRLQLRYVKISAQLELCKCDSQSRDSGDGKVSIESKIPRNPYSKSSATVLSTPGKQDTVELEGTVLKRKVKDEMEELPKFESIARAEAADFTSLQEAVYSLRLSVLRFSRDFLRGLANKADLTADRLLNTFSTEAYLSRKHHALYVLRSHIYQALFSEFKVQSYEVVSRPSCWQRSDFMREDPPEYFTSEQVDLDPNFSAFCERILHQLSKDFLLPLAVSDPEEYSTDKTTGLLEYIGGLCLASQFREVCKAICLVHKMVSAPDPPASIFMVPRDTYIDGHFMEAVINVEDDANLVKNVGFMIAPGFRVKGNILRAEVYPSGRKKELQLK